MIGKPFATLFQGKDVELGLPEHELEVAAADARSQDDRWHVRKDGTRIWLSGATVPLRSRDGKLLGFAKAALDRTDLRSQIETLEHRIDDAEAFFGRMAHELRNSLSPLSNAVQLVERNPASAAEMLPIVRRQLDVLQRLSQDAHDLARLHTGKLDLRLQEVDLAAHLRTVADGLHVRVSARGQSVRILAPAEPIVVRADPQRLHQVFYNLLDNAVKYSPPQSPIWVKVSTEADEAVARIEDVGVGIPAELLPRIFELFTQASPAEPESGLGIGLSLVRELVHAHHGTIEVRSAGPGKGSEFTVRLPL